MGDPDEHDEHDGPFIQCWNCGGECVVCDCWDEIACVDPESGCDQCRRRCPICRGKGGWPESVKSEPPQPPPAERSQ